jgi:oligopeptide transport system substrate-binding protein
MTTSNLSRFKAALAAVLAATIFATLMAAPVSAEMVLHRGTGGEPSTLDPHHATGTWENDIIGDLFLGLMTEDAAGNPILGAAESWSVSADGTVYTFVLRQDGRWSDGVPVTSEDFVFAMRRILAPETAAAYASILYPIKNAESLNSGALVGMENLGVQAIDDYTLQITLENPTPYFIT